MALRLRVFGRSGKQPETKNSSQIEPSMRLEFTARRIK
jgi:hypothetical protein